MDIILDSLNKLGIVALCLLAFGWSLRIIKNIWLRKVVVGIVFGAGAVVAMLHPIAEIRGYQADGRYVFIVLISAFSGFWSGLIAVIMSVTTRLLIGGQGAYIGSLLIAACVGLAVIWGHVTRRSRKRSLASWLVLSLIASFPIGIGFAIVSPDAPYTASVRLLFTLACILLFGKLMETEMRRADRERELNREAGVDFLTQLPNRRALTAHLSSSKMAESKPRAYLMIDIDHFKSINDEYGHFVGDDVLREIGARLRNAMRRDDYAARVGGEEFAVVLCLSGRDETQRIAERIRGSLSHDFSIGGKTFPVTASLGGVFVEDDRLDSVTAFNLADRALYKAKRAGRDRTVISTEVLL